MRKFLHFVALYGFHLFVVRPVLRGLGGVRFKGRNRLPEGPCLVVSNHNSHLDAAILMSLFPLRRLSRVHPVAAADYFGASAFKRTVAMMCMNGIPIDRSTAGRDTLVPAAGALRAGDSLVFFPEGSRGKAGVVARFRPGIGLLVRQIPGLPVVPVFLSGPERIWPRGRFVPVPLNIDANVGRPRVFPDASDPRQIAEQIRADVLALAPAAPPVPGARPSPPLRVAVWGADAASRDRVGQRVLEILGRLDGALGVGPVLLEADERGVRPHSGRVPSRRSRRWLRRWAWLLRMGRREDRRRFADLIERSHLEEALRHAADVRFLVTRGCALLDLLMRAAPFAGGKTGQDEAAVARRLRRLLDRTPIPWRRAWIAVREAPELWLLSVFDLARPPVPDVVVHVVPPGGADPASRRLLSALARVRPVTVVEVEVDGTGPVPDKLAMLVERACGEAMDAPPRAEKVTGR